jgi:hypothetical protein
MNDRLMSYLDVSEKWQKPVSTLRYWVMQKKLIPIKLGRSVRFKESYILECEEKGVR